MNQSDRKKRILALLLHVLCALFVMGLAVFTRSQASSFLKNEGQAAEMMTDENGLPYLTDMDSYYHVRLLDNCLSKGSFGDLVKEDGTPWDLHSFAPEGRSADYQPGIIWTAALAHRLLGIGTDVLAYKLMAFLSALAALAAYCIGVRISGFFGGIAAGIVIGCGPQFAVRTSYGRFDTDVFIIILELCLIFAMSEALRAKTKKQRMIHTVLFALVSLLYSFCWMPRYAILFTGLTIAGGVLYVLAELLIRKRAKNHASGLAAVKDEITVLGSLAAAVVISQLLVFGADLVSGVISALSFTNEAAKGKEALPNLFVSVSELGKTTLFPKDLSKVFSGYVANESPSAVNGVGGILVFLTAFTGLLVLFYLGFPHRNRKIEEEKRRVYSLYAWLLFSWLAACLFLLGYGLRFIEHLSIPVGLLAGGLIGILFQNSLLISRKENGAPRIEEVFPLSLIPALVLFPCAVVPTVRGAADACRDVRPSVSDASVKAMDFIRENSETDDALIVTWWDMGYFYESNSDHPCLWDGGSQNWIRGIFVARALVSDDPELSRRIMVMLANTGNAAMEKLMEHTDAKNAMSLLLKTIGKEKEETVTELQEAISIGKEEAASIEALLHPEAKRETWLVITYTMTRQIGWYEYFSGWDFSGSQPVPNATLYSYTPEGTPLFNTEAGQAYLAGVRGKETMWELFFNAKKTPYFQPAFEWHDGMEHVRIWRVEE